MLEGRKVKIEWPRLRTVDGEEVVLVNYNRLQSEDFLDTVEMERMLYSAASRHHEKVSNAVFSELRTYGMLGSTLSERFARRAAELVGRIL
ncbi:MAG: IS256 family transposase, partial [Thermoproteota archaeon]